MSPASAMSFADLGDAADVLDAVRIGEAEIAVEAMAHIVAVEQIGVTANRRELASRQDWRWSICRRRRAR